MEADLSEVAAGSADAATEVQLKICRDGKVQKVAIRLAQDHGLGTRRLVHWCGAQFQVRSVCVALHLDSTHDETRCLHLGISVWNFITSLNLQTRQVSC